MSKTHLLVGGNSGIGLALAKILKGQGHQPMAAVRKPGELSAMGIPTFDAREPAAWPLPERLDGLVYLPGSITLKPFHRLTREDFLHDMEVNFFGAVAAIQSALPALKSSPSASLVLFSTIAVAQGMTFHASIASAKAAVEGLALSLAAELAPNIRVNVIAPSLTDTPLASPLVNSEAKLDAAAKRHPLRRIGSAQDVASLAAWLLSDASSFMTGQILRPDGGLSSVRTF